MTPRFRGRAAAPAFLAALAFALFAAACAPGRGGVPGRPRAEAGRDRQRDGDEPGSEDARSHRPDPWPFAATS